MSSSLDKLRAAMESASPTGGEKKSYSDDTMWKPELDKSGNGYAVVRFLPTPEGRRDAMGIIFRPRFPRARWLVY